MAFRDSPVGRFLLGPVEQRDAFPYPAIPSNGSIGGKYGTVAITTDTAMQNSAVWACLSLRAGLVSSFPAEVYRERDGRNVKMTPPPVIRNPGGVLVSRRQWMYSTQLDLDRAGNAFGLAREFSATKTERWPLGVPSVIDLVQLGNVKVRRRERDNELVYTIGGKEYDWRHVWHEKAYTVAGLDVGLSPIAYAAYALGSYLSAQTFALDWFTGKTMPAAILKNTKKELNPDEAAIIKGRAQAAMEPGGLFVTGNDWELDPLSATTAQSEFITTMQYGVPEIARFFGVPADLIDGAVAGASVTYANLSQRNLQFLITKLGPAVEARQDALSTLTSSPRFVLLDTTKLLQLDHLQQAQLDKINIEARTRVPSELRERDNLAPYTPEQLAEIATLFPNKTSTTPEDKAAA